MSKGTYQIALAIAVVAIVYLVNKRKDCTTSKITFTQPVSTVEPLGGDY